MQAICAPHGTSRPTPPRPRAATPPPAAIITGRLANLRTRGTTKALVQNCHPGLGQRRGGAYRATPSFSGCPMPYKANEPRRHKIPRARYKVRNWPAYDRALQQRGSLTVWVTPEALAAWHPPRTGGAQHQVALRDVLLDVALASLVKDRDLVPVWVFLPLSVLVPHPVIGRDRDPHDLARLRRNAMTRNRITSKASGSSTKRWIVRATSRQGC